MRKDVLLTVMGHRITVEKVLRKVDVLRTGEKDFKREHRDEKIEPRAGWIVGVRNIADGTIVQTEHRNVFVQKKGTSREVYLVAFWPTQKPVLVPRDGVCFGWLNGVQPYTTCGFGPKGPERDRMIDRLRTNMKHTARNERGEWVAP